VGAQQYFWGCFLFVLSHFIGFLNILKTLEETLFELVRFLGNLQALGVNPPPRKIISHDRGFWGFWRF